jgi:uncharacterized protein DUF6644
MLPFFQWCEGTAIGKGIRDSSWLFPTIEAVHLIGLALIGGAVLILNLRLLGIGFERQPIARVARDAWPWLVGSLVAMIATGIPLFLSEAIKCYYSPAFWIKMASLAMAIIFTFTVHRRVMFDELRLQPAARRVVAAISLTLWLGVGIGGRWIGFS